MQTLDDNHICPVTYFDDRGVRPRTGKNMSTDPNLQALERGVTEDYVGLSLQTVTGYALGDQITPRTVKALVRFAQGFLQNLKTMNGSRISRSRTSRTQPIGPRTATFYRLKVRMWQTRALARVDLEVGPDVVTVTPAA